MSMTDSAHARISAEIGAEVTSAETNLPPRTCCRSSSVTCASSALRSAPPADRRSTSLWNSWESISQIRGTKISSVGRASARSSRIVDRSLLAAKYAVPPLPNVPYRTVRPTTWLIGVKLSVIDGSVLGSPHALFDLHQKLVASRWVSIAPLGAPVLPEV